MSHNNPIEEVRLKEFIQDARKFIKEFASLAEDLFQGERLEQLAVNFIERHQQFLSQFHSPLSKLSLESASQMDCIKDDFRLLNLDIPSDRSHSPASTSSSSKNNLNVIHALLAQIYSSACKGSYLRLTYNLSRLNREEDRQVPVDWARKAIRFNVNDFEVLYWYMVAIGWQVDNMPSSKERIVVSQIFKLATLRCQKLNPQNPLAFHLLGRYYFNVAQLGWLERAIIKTLLLHDTSGQFKIEGSYAEAEQKFLHAHSLKDDWPPSGLWMARALLAQKRPMAEVKQWIAMGLGCECKEPSTELERRQLLELEAKLKID